ncbi:MAG: phosphoesterase PA-phosphatase, partial [Clostridia bacterium]|nr:phosphoesterase PA-phosphatase [Clostridia bacterium]
MNHFAVFAASAKRRLLLSAALLATFALLTLAVLFLDVAPAGPLHSPVGLSSLNLAFHHLTGVHLSLYTLTDMLSLVPLGVVLFFGLLGLCQWVHRRSLLRVDPDVLLLGVFYFAVLSAFALVEL